MIFFATILFQTHRQPRLTMLDVGQGDSFLVDTKHAHRILIDTGPAKSGVVRKVKKYLSYFDNRIDVLIISHFDADHVGEVKSVIEEYKPELVVLPAYDFGKNKLHEVYTQNFFGSSSDKTKFIQLFQNDSVVVGNNTLDIFYPRMIDHVELKNNNETSLVFKSKQSNSTDQNYCKEKSVLFTGDIGSTAEQKIIFREKLLHQNLESDLRADILKVAHHGSRYSSTANFIERVGASEAMISYAEKNNYGHPNQNTIARLKKYGTDIFLPGELGDAGLSLCK